MTSLSLDEFLSQREEQTAAQAEATAVKMNRIAEIVETLDDNVDMAYANVCEAREQLSCHDHGDCSDGSYTEDASDYLYEAREQVAHMRSAITSLIRLL